MVVDGPTTSSGDLNSPGDVTAGDFDLNEEIRRRRWFFGPGPGGEPLLCWWDSARDDTYTQHDVNLGRNWDGITPNQIANFPWERGFNAVVIEQSGFSMGPRSDPFFPGGLVDAPFFGPTGTFPPHVTEWQPYASRLAKRYLNQKLQSVTSAYVMLPPREILWAFVHLNGRENDPAAAAVAFAHLKRFIEECLDTSAWTPSSPTDDDDHPGTGGVPDQDRILGFYLLDEPSLIRRYPVPVDPLRPETARPTVCGVSCPDDLLVDAVDLELTCVTANDPYQLTWDLGGGGTITSTSADQHAVTVDLTSDPDPEGYLLTVTARNAWGDSQQFVVRYFVVATAEEAVPIITGLSARVGDIGFDRRLPIIPPPNGSGAFDSRLCGGHEQHAHFELHVLGKVAEYSWLLVGSRGSWSIPNPVPSDDFLDLTLPSVDASAPATWPHLSGLIYVTNVDGTTSRPIDFDASVSYEPIYAYGSFMTPQFHRRLAELVREVQLATRPAEIPKPVLTTHNVALVRDRFWGEDGIPRMRPGDPPPVMEGFGVAGRYLRRDGQVAIDPFRNPSEWRLLGADPRNPFYALDAHALDHYPLIVDDTDRDVEIESVLDALELDGADRLLKRIELRQGIHTEDFIWPFQWFRLMRKGSVRVGAAPQDIRRNRDFLTGLGVGLEREEVPVPGGGTQEVNITPRRASLFWGQAWGQPYRIGSQAGSSADPASPSQLDILYRFLRKPAIDGDGRSDEARRQAWHAIAGGSHGMGWFAQFFVADEIIRDVYVPIAWEIRYADLRWNSDILTSATGITYTYTPPGPSQPNPWDHGWLQPIAMVLRRRTAFEFVDENEDPETFPVGGVYLLLVNRGQQEIDLSLTIPTGQFGTEPGGPNESMEWVRYKYRERVAGPITVPAFGTQVFTVPQNDVHIYHLETP